MLKHAGSYACQFRLWTDALLSPWQQLEKMQEEGQLVEKPFERKALRFRFPELERSGRTVLEIKKMCFHYDDKVR